MAIPISLVEGGFDPVAVLRDPGTIRARANMLYELALAGQCDHFSIDSNRMEPTAYLVERTTRMNYPNLRIPYHSRWRHFSAGGTDRWGQVAEALSELTPAELARTRIDLTIVSVLLDAGSGPDWKYLDPWTRKPVTRSEGLGIASLKMFLDGCFSNRHDRPFQVDAEALMAITPEKLAHGFQVSDTNPLEGIEGRAALLNNLGKVMLSANGVLGEGVPRLGNLYDSFIRQANGGPLRAADLLKTVLTLFSPIWPGRTEMNGQNLGDVWRHSKIRTGDATNQLMPFHKLSQWLTYSLIEPIEDAGVAVTEMDALTGLAEYRNGGLFIDSGVMVPKHDAVLGQAHAPDSEIVVEWRALTIAMIDRIAAIMRRRLGVTPVEFPLARVLEGGTWSAGRMIARDKRPDGTPPIKIISDGTVF